MKAVLTHVGKCDTCGVPAVYGLLTGSGKLFAHYCEEHAPEHVKKQANSMANKNDSASK